MSHHPTLSPSKFPMLARCPCFVSGEVGEAAQAGTRQHELLAALLENKTGIDAAFGCNAEEIAQVEWAAERVRIQTGNSRLIEERLSLVGDEFEEITFGTADVVDLVNRAAGDRLVLIDYKSGEDHGYLPQMAVYARMAMLRFGKSICEVHELYGRRRFDKNYDLNMADTDFVMDIIAAAQKADRKPALCEFCGWCARQGDCVETVGAIVKVATEYEPDHPAAKTAFSEISTLHASRITSPEEMSVVLHVAEFVGKWADAVKEHARAAALKGMIIPGYQLQDGRSRREFMDILDVYAASGLDEKEFLSCCSCSVPGIEKALATRHGFKSEKTKDAKANFDALLGALVVKKPGAQVLKRMEG